MGPVLFRLTAPIQHGHVFCPGCHGRGKPAANFTLSVLGVGFMVISTLANCQLIPKLVFHTTSAEAEGNTSSAEVRRKCVYAYSSASAANIELLSHILHKAHENGGHFCAGSRAMRGQLHCGSTLNQPFSIGPLHGPHCPGGNITIISKGA